MYSLDAPTVSGAPEHESLVFCYVPLELRPPSARELYFWGQPHAYLGVQDLTAVNRRAEIRWFRAEFATECRLLSARFGHRPRFRWGLLDRSS